MGNAQELIGAGTTTGGEMQYSLNGTDYSREIPMGMDAKEYTVYYKVVGDINHNDTATQTIAVTVTRTTPIALDVIGRLPRVQPSRKRKPVVTLTHSGKEMEEGRDYTVSYTKNILKGTATVTFQGIERKGYTGSLKKTFKILPKPVESGDIKAEIIGSLWKEGKHEVPFTKQGTTPEIRLTVSGNELKAGRDYTVKYSDNKKIGQTATITIKGKGNYGGSRSLTFEIVGKELSNENGIRVVVKDKTGEKANNWKQAVKVLDANQKALGAADYDKKNITFTQIADRNGPMEEKVLNPGEKAPIGAVIKVTVTGMGDYTGKGGIPATASGTFRILEKGYDISKATIKISPQPYTSEGILIAEQEQFTKLHLKIGGEKKPLVLGKDIEVVEGSYVRNVDKGTARVTFRGMEGTPYGGTKTVTFKITARNTSDLWEVIY